MIIYPFREESSPEGLMQTAETIAETNGSIYYIDYAPGFDIVLVSSGKKWIIDRSNRKFKAKTQQPIQKTVFWRVIRDRIVLNESGNKRWVVMGQLERTYKCHFFFS